MSKASGERPGLRWRGSAGVALVTLASVMGCTTAQVTSGAFAQVGRIETELRRGVSTKMDVQRVLGAPKGVGATLLPTDPRPRELWYYEDFAMTALENESPGRIRAQSRQQIILVMFDKETFDGFIWYTAAVPLESK
jgi:hypothetical protein